MYKQTQLNRSRLSAGVSTYSPEFTRRVGVQWRKEREYLISQGVTDDHILYNQVKRLEMIKQLNTNS